MKPPMASMLVLTLAGCEGGRAPCQRASDCDPAEHCLVDGETSKGQCVATPGRDVEVPPRRFMAGAGRTDMLLVVDDGPSTVALQARFIASLEGLVERSWSEHDDLRVAVTTANAISPICDPRSAASQGALVASSCLDRLDDFVAADGTDAQWLCTDACAYTSAQLGLDAEHPWLDVRQLPEGIESVDALACLVPQGISGCEYAAPLEAMRAALEHGTDPDARDSSWMRFEGWTMVTIVTDAVDCSLGEVGEAAFDPDGERALWSDPEAMEPTPAVCWNAGVECDGEPTGLACSSIDRDVDGMPTNSAASVLAPLSSYDESLDFVFSLTVISGTTVDDPRSPVYSAVGDAAFLLEHGIDPGCSDADVTALPPVRLQEMADQLASVCAPEYIDVLSEPVWSAVTCLEPSCDATALEIAYEPPGGPPEAIPMCEGAYPYLEVPAGTPGCWYFQADSERCPGSRSLELRLHTADIRHTGAFLVTPDPWSPVDGC